MTVISYILIALLFYAFFSGMGSAFISSSILHQEADNKNRHLSGRILDVFYRNPDQFLSTLFIGNTIALVVFSLQMTIFLNPYVDNLIASKTLSFLSQFIIVAVSILFIGMLIPNILCRINSNFSLKFFSVPLYVFYLLFYPVSKVISTKKTPSKIVGEIALDYFFQRNLEDNSQKSDMETEVKIFQNALDFSNVRLRDCMVPRTEIVACGVNATMGELKSKFIETGLSKIVIYNESIDNIIGYLHSSELFKNPDNWADAIQSVSIVPETMAANKLMKLLMQEKKSLAIVVDEFGGTSGIITLEDLVEEIFGEIEDEHDTKSHIARKVAEDEYLLSGRMEIDSVNELFNLDLPESDDYVTVAGYILDEYKSFPKLNETISIGKYTFKIIKVTATKIELVRLKVENE